MILVAVTTHVKYQSAADDVDLLELVMERR